MGDLKKQFDNQLKEAQENTVLSAEYRRKKLIMYVIRTTIAVALFYFLWEHEWIKWVLYIYIPLNLIFLISIFVMPYFLKRKINKTHQLVDEVDQQLEEFEEE